MKDNQRNGPTRGMTLIEIIITLALALTLAAFAVGGYQLFYSRAVLDREATALLNTLKEAQDYSVSVREGRRYGVRFDAGGNSYQLLSEGAAGEVVEKDHRLGSGVVFVAVDFGPNDEVWFTKLRGEPSTNGSATLRGRAVTTTISIGSSGIIERE